MIPERVKVAAGILLTGLPKANEPKPVNGARMWGEVPTDSPFTDELVAAQRNSAALSMCDEEVIGYVLMTVRRDARPAAAEVRVLSEVPRELWSAVAETMRRLARAAHEAA